MGTLSKLALAACVAAGGAVTSQLPEFAQQYRQRLGGAVEELGIVIADFDRDATANGLTRLQAVDALRNSAESLPRARGESMNSAVSRFEHLVSQREAFERASPLVRPVTVLLEPDPKVVAGAWEIFEPAVPLTRAGGIYAGAGGLAAGLLGWLGLVGIRRVRRQRPDRQLSRAEKATGKSNPVEEALLGNLPGQNTEAENESPNNGIDDAIYTDSRFNPLGPSKPPRPPEGSGS